MEETVGERRELMAWMRRAWAWTFGGLPGWLVLPGLMGRWSRDFRIDALPLGANIPRSGELLDVQLGPALILKKELRFPKALRKNLTRAVDVNMRQSLPGGGSELLWRHSIHTRDTVDLVVHVYLLKKSVLDEVMTLMSAHNTKLRMIGVADAPNAAPFLDRRTHADRPKWVWALTTALLLVALIGGFVWRSSQVTGQLNTEIARLQTLKSELSQKAIDKRTQLASEDATVAQISNDLALFNLEYRRLPILVDLTRTLGDGTWISDFAAIEKDARLSGFTDQDVTDVMAQIRELPWVAQVDLEGPVSFDSFSRKSRFDLIIKTKADAGQKP